MRTVNFAEGINHMMDKKPVVLVVMDGVGKTEKDLGNMVLHAQTPTLDQMMETCPNTVLQAHGTAVGLPSDEDMGNSEVGHNALGCGQVYAQGAKLVNESIETGKLFESETWLALTGRCVKTGGALHLVGLLSDGNVHSNISHLKALIQNAKAQGVKAVRVHALLDGRDVPATSALQYVDDIEAFMAALNDETFNACISSGGGRMKVTMDRYQANWSMVKLGWDTHVRGIGRQFASAREAVETYRAETGAIDQDLPAFVIAKNGQPAGKIMDGDSVVLFNFRGDRALELSMAFDYENFDHFDRGPRPDVLYAGMLQYDGDLKLPRRFLVSPPAIRHTLSELLVQNGIPQYAVSETQKYGHVTYFWNGNRSEKFDDQLETFLEVPSDVRSFDEAPWMKAAEVTDKMIEAIQSRQYGFLRCNYPNGDMVGHTGNLDATRIAVESVDLSLARVLKACRENGCILMVTADHGNADEMLQKNKKGEMQPKTAHSLNPVPFILYDGDTAHTLKAGAFGLANVAPTVAQLLGLKAPDCWLEGMLAD